MPSNPLKINKKTPNFLLSPIHVENGELRGPVCYVLLCPALILGLESTRLFQNVQLKLAPFPTLSLWASPASVKGTADFKKHPCPDGRVLPMQFMVSPSFKGMSLSNCRPTLQLLFQEQKMKDNEQSSTAPHLSKFVLWSTATASEG